MVPRKKVRSLVDITTDSLTKTIRDDDLIFVFTLKIVVNIVFSEFYTYFLKPS